MSRFKGVTYLTDEQYATLVANGTLTVEGVTINYDQDMLYVTPQTESGGGSAGVSQEEFNKLLNNTTIIMPNANESILLGSSSAAALTSTQSVIIGKNAKAVSKGVAIGYDAMTTEANGGVAVGDYAETENGVAIGREAEAIGDGVAIGNFAETSADKSIAIGGNETKPAQAFGTSGNIQIGGGTNNTDNTVQVADDNIYNYNTHTLTVQNISLNGSDLQGTLSGLQGQNEYIGSYTGSDYTANTIQSMLNAFVQTTESRSARNGDIVNIVNGIYGGQQWINSDGTWKYYIDFENHSVINNLTSTSTTDGLSAMQGKVLNDMLTTLAQEVVGVQGDVSDIDGEISRLNGEISRLDGGISSNTQQIGTLQSAINGKTNVTFNNVHQNTVNFSSDPQTQINSLSQSISTNTQNISLKANQSSLDQTNSSVSENRINISSLETNKADRELTNVTYPTIVAGNTRTGVADRVVENYLSSDGRTWYRKWASGWKECGIRDYGTGLNWSYHTLTYPISFTQKPIVVGSYRGDDSTNTITSRSFSLFNITTSSVQLYADSGLMKDIYICGY